MKLADGYMKRAFCGLAVLLWLGLLAGAIAQVAPAPAPAPKLVFAHYMVCYHNSVEGYQREIALAQQHGIDGFALNCGAWGDMTKDGFKPGSYTEAAMRLYEAAKRLDSGFKLFFSPDMNGLGNLPVNIGDMVTRFKDHPNQFKAGDLPVLSGWAGTPSTYAKAIGILREGGTPVCFVPFVYNRRFAMAWSMETTLRFLIDQPHMDGLFHFAADDDILGIIERNATGRRATYLLGKKFMAGVAPCFNSPNLRDFQGMAGYGAIWEGIIADQPDWVEIVTWNDYNEDSNLMPARWPFGQEKRFQVRDESFLDVTAYYASWYKTGQAPAITQDKVYLVYRNRSRWLTRAYDVKKGEWTDILSQPYPFDQIHDDVLDRVYVTAFLTAPATLALKVGGQEERRDLPAGIQHLSLPMAPGVPELVLSRAGQELDRVAGRRQILAEATESNSAFQTGEKHLHNRTWGGGLAIGPVLRLEAEAGTLTEGAEVVTVGGVKGVRIAARDGASVTLPVQGLKPGTYNLRLIAQVAGPDDARLTLSTDGWKLGEKEPAVQISAWMPVSGEGFTSSGCFWSLTGTTSHLRLAWRSGLNWGKPMPLDDDRGEVVLDAIELVYVAPVTPTPAPAVSLPAMVRLPGGEFTRGSADGEPDERPPHQVTVDAFAIGQFEVTNAEYERFEPTHRELRDGYSWRDREPVIYVGWRQAAGYCNWLSTQHGLTPVYDEKTWAMDRAANGFRLPTEAEWEYAASGRSEGRPYPWGKAKPEPGVHGNFVGPEILALPRPVRAGGEARGVALVGSYPAGVSRDGLHDLAGNVAEWVSDWFLTYGAAAISNPHADEKANHRSIRGGSWGYYGHSQRVTDREYNNPNYPGYIYLGFRLALSEAGYRQLYGQ